MNILEKEAELRKSQMAYPLKATFYIRDVSFLPCPDCPFKDEYPPVSLVQKTEDCFKRCPYEIIVWILSKEQLDLYERVRSSEKKKADIEKAIREGKIIKVEETLRGV